VCIKHRDSCLPSINIDASGRFVNLKLNKNAVNNVDFDIHFSSVIPSTSSVNIALRQPTWQSTTYQSYTSDKAVDGNKDTNFVDGFCSHTGDNDPSPWLAVDLGTPTDVYGAAVTNRGDAQC
jgi:F5/8 type C domain